MAEEKQAAAEAEGAPHPAETQAGSEQEKPRPATLTGTKFLILPITAALYAGIVIASSGFTERVVVPKLSTWLVTQEAERLASEARAQELPPFGQIFVIEDLVVNPAESGGMRYACISVGLESADPSVIEELKTRDAQIKDCLIQVFGSKTVEELADIDSREGIRAEIKTRIDELLPGEGLDAVYFVNFVLQ